MSRYLVIDIGGTFIKYAWMNEKAEIEKKGKVPTPLQKREDLIASIGALYDQDPDIRGIALSMPGIIDSENGYCAMGGALRYNDDFYLRHALFQRCPVAISMENDAKCAAKAEAVSGALSNVNDGFVLIFGTMIGGAYIKDQQLVKGKHYSAGEVSYLCTDDRKLPYAEHVWGNTTSAAALCREYAEKIHADEKEIDGIRFFRDVDQGIGEAIEVLNHFTTRIAMQIFNIQMLVDPEKFAIGGGISAQPVLVEYIRANLKRLYDACPYYVPHAEVCACKYGNDANMIGALYCLMEQQS